MRPRAWCEWTNSIIQLVHSCLILRNIRSRGWEQWNETLWFRSGFVIKPKIILAENTVHRCLSPRSSISALPASKPSPLSPASLVRSQQPWDVGRVRKKGALCYTRKRLVERTRDILVPLKRDPLPPRPNLKYHSVWITCLAKNVKSNNASRSNNILSPQLSRLPIETINPN